MRLLAGAGAICLLAVAAHADRPVPVADDVISGVAMPRNLSDYNFFQDAGGTKPNKGVTLYRLNSPLFTDYADKFRYIYVPAGKTLSVNPDNPEGMLQFPVGSAIIKSFGYEMDGKPRLLETRVFLHRADGWLALPYVWNEEQTEATLKVAGKRIPITFTDPSGKERSISYAVPNKNQCKECHSLSDAVVPIGPKLRNLTHDSKDILASNGILNGVTGNEMVMPDFRDDRMPLADRARAYLDVNCAHCHNGQGSASNSGLFLTYEEKEPVRFGVGKRPVAAGRGSGGHEFSIKPGHPEESIMVYRLKSLDPGVAMPEVGRSLVHDEGVALLSEWIDSL
ncbi:MAG: hypothetical protein Pars2KO_24680 [Parasphingorhabdus sp.]